jgi:acyl carrier protein
MKRTRQQVLAEVLELVHSVVQDWDFESPVTEQTRLYADLAFESLDLVVLGATVQERFGRTFPFTELFAEIGQRDVHDLTIGEWVDFLERHLAEPAPASGPAPAAIGGQL